MLYSTAFIDLTFYTKAICLNPCKVSGAPVVQPGRKRLQPRHYSALPSDLESGSHCRSVHACKSSVMQHCGKAYRPPAAQVPRHRPVFRYSQHVQFFSLFTAVTSGHMSNSQHPDSTLSSWVVVGSMNCIVVLNVFSFYIFCQQQSWIVKNSVHTAGANQTWPASFVGSGLGDVNWALGR